MVFLFRIAPISAVTAVIIETAAVLIAAIVAAFIYPFPPFQIDDCGWIDNVYRGISSIATWLPRNWLWIATFIEYRHL